MCRRVNWTLSWGTAALVARGEVNGETTGLASGEADGEAPGPELVTVHAASPRSAETTNRDTIRKRCQEKSVEGVCMPPILHQNLYFRLWPSYEERSASRSR